MKKSQLLKMEYLHADHKIIQFAKEQKLKVGYSGEYHYAPYEAFFKVCKKDGILKVAIFLTKYLVFSAPEPVYDVYLDKENEDFITYDYSLKKWLKAKIDRLPEQSRIRSSEVFCSNEDTKSIQEYIGNDDSVYDCILFFQMSIREKELERKHRKVTDVWKKRMEQVPELPKDWTRWLFKVGVTQHFIFYQYERNGAKEGYCTWCEKKVPINNPKHNKKGRCQCCGHKIQFKSIGKGKKICTDEETAYLIQRCKEGIVVREFRANMLYLNSAFEKPLHFSREQRRIIYDSNWKGTQFYYGNYKKRGEMMWIEGSLSLMIGLFYMGEETYHAGKIYGRTIPSLSKKELRDTGLQEWMKKTDFISPRHYFAAIKRKPYLEKIIKAGLIKLAQELMDTVKEIEFTEKKGLGKSLGIDHFRMKRLRKNNGGILFLEWLKKEKKEKKIIDDEVLQWLEEVYIQPNELSFISDRMSERQIKNYIECQTKGQKNKVKGMISIWEDYLSMAKRAHFDVNDSIVYRAKDLRKRHDEMVQIIKDKELTLQAAEIAEKFPQVDAICEGLKAKYEYEGQEYCIIAPDGIEDVLKEGRMLHHCIDKSSNYFDRISKKETYILFLRKRERSDVPYYTLEVEPDGTIRQKRTDFNRQHTDIKLIEEFLGKWQDNFKKN